MNRVTWIGLSLAVILGSAFGPFVCSAAAKPASSGTIAYVKGGDLWLMKSSGAKKHRLKKTSKLEARPFWAPDGRTIYFSRRASVTHDPINGTIESWDLMKIDAVTRKSKLIARGFSQLPIDGDVSPNGKKFALCSQNFKGQGGVVIHKRTTSGTLSGELKNPFDWSTDEGGALWGVHQYLPRFSRTGADLAFSGGPRYFDDGGDSGYDVAVAHLSTGSLRWAIVDGGNWTPAARGLDWSKNGKWIAFGSNKDGYGSGYSDLYVVDAATHSQRRVTSAYHELYLDPSFSPASTRIALQMVLTSKSVSSDARAGIWTMNLTGKQRRFLGSGSQPAWCTK